MDTVKVIAEGRFPSASQPGITWHAQVFDNGRFVCECLGFKAHAYCWHVRVLTHPPKQKRKKKE